MAYNLYNLTTEEIKIAIIQYIIENKKISTSSELSIMENKYDIRFIVEDTYQKDSLTGYYKPELKGVEISILE
jgi:CRISPR/Cas system CSM-associated protein Csm4 (group 5 of RAMP superfamily)